LAALFVIVIAAGIGYYVKVIRTPGESDREQVAQTTSATQLPPDSGALLGAGRGADTDETATASETVSETVSETASRGADSEAAADSPAPGATTAEPPAAAATDGEGSGGTFADELAGATAGWEAAEATGGDQASGGVAGGTAGDAVAGDAMGDEAASVPAGWQELRRDRFTEPVGQAGWALWLYSLPDSALAKVEIRELQRRGLRAVYRPVQIEDRGEWYRVYVGSFPDRRSAVAAAEPLGAVLDHDWIRPVRF
jgi:hypothetical protein